MCTFKKEGMNVMMFNTGDLILDAVILSIVARTPEGTYGYKITQDVRSKMDVPESTFYPLLKQMQMDGYLEVYHKDLGGRSRRFYKITESGKERLEFCQQNWTNYLQSASNLLMSAPAQQSEAPVEPVAPTQPVMAEAPVEPVAPVQPVMAEVQVEPVVPAQPVMAEVQVEPVAPAQPVMVEAPAEPEFRIASSDGMAAMEFSIGGDEIVSDGDNLLSDEGDLFELSSASVNGAISIEEPIVSEAPVEPVAPAQPVMAETPVGVEADDEADFMAEMALGDAEEVVEETTVEETETLADNMSELESLISQLRSFETTMNAHREYTENNTPENTGSINITDVSGVAALLAPSTQPEQATAENARYAEVRNPDTDDSVNSLVDLLKDDQPTKKSGFFKSKVAKASSSIRSMVSDTANAAMEAAKTSAQESHAQESVSEETPQTVTPVKYQEVRNPDTDDSVNSLVDLLKDDQPAQKPRLFRPRAEKVASVEKASTPAPQPEKVETVASQAAPKVKFTEVRSTGADDAVDSLVDLLKGDDTASKPKLFKAWGSKSSTPSQEVSATPAPDVQPIEKVVEAKPVVEAKEIRSTAADDAVDSLVDLLKGDDTTSKPRLFRSRAQKTATPEKAVVPTPSKDSTPVQSVREVSEASSSVDSLVDLLKDDKAEKKQVSIFGKASAKPYTKVSAPTPAAPSVSAPATPVASVDVSPTPVQDAVIPEPVVSEPRVFAPKVSSVTNKPAAAKTFEAKAASPNARPVETTATITKPLEAKAISTNPAVAKSAEAKSVETKAVVTPKAETTKPETAPAVEETAKEEIPMDSFKYRLMQANLLPDEK